MAYFEATIMVKKASAVLFLVLFIASPLTAFAAEARSADPQFERERKKDRIEIDQEKRMEKARNVDRQKELKQDTEKLLELATELKQYVDKTNENVLSLEVIKKAEEIEKLAKNVKNKMKESVK